MEIIARNVVVSKVAFQTFGICHEVSRGGRFLFRSMKGYRLALPLILGLLTGSMADTGTSPPYVNSISPMSNAIK